MTAADDAERRYYVLPPDEREPVCFSKPEIARRFAVEFGDGTHVVDTLASPYYPMVQRVEHGEAVYLEFGGWDTRTSPDLNLIEAVKKGYAPIVRAFLVKGTDVRVSDGNGGTVLIWAAAGGNTDIAALLLAAGADVDAADQGGTTALALAERKGHDAIIAMLREAGASIIRG